jgi:uncharacterized protein (TIGR02217 family)
MHLRRYLPAEFAWGWSGGPRFNTDIVPMANGAEKRNAVWSQGRHQYKCAFKHLSTQVFGKLKAHHGVVRGMLHAFLFNDGMDPEAIDEPFGIGDGVEKVFQLNKLSEADGQQYRRIVYALYRPGADGAAIASTPDITINGVPTNEFTVDHDRGTVTFTTAPANDAVLRWSGRFAVWVRLDRDELDFAMEYEQGIYGTLGAIEVKPPLDSEVSPTP